MPSNKEILISEEFDAIRDLYLDFSNRRESLIHIYHESELKESTKKDRVYFGDNITTDILQKQAQEERNLGEDQRNRFFSAKYIELFKQAQNSKKTSKELVELYTSAGLLPKCRVTSKIKKVLLTSNIQIVDDEKRKELIEYYGRIPIENRKLAFAEIIKSIAIIAGMTATVYNKGQDKTVNLGRKDTGMQEFMEYALLYNSLVDGEKQIAFGCKNDVMKTSNNTAHKTKLLNALIPGYTNLSLHFGNMYGFIKNSVERKLGLTSSLNNSSTLTFLHILENSFGNLQIDTSSLTNDINVRRYGIYNQGLINSYQTDEEKEWISKLNKIEGKNDLEKVMRFVKYDSLPELNNREVLYIIQKAGYGKSILEAVDQELDKREIARKAINGINWSLNTYDITQATSEEYDRYKSYKKEEELEEYIAGIQECKITPYQRMFISDKSTKLEDILEQQDQSKNIKKDRIINAINGIKNSETGYLVLFNLLARNAKLKDLDSKSTDLLNLAIYESNNGDIYNYVADYYDIIGIVNDGEQLEDEDKDRVYGLYKPVIEVYSANRNCNIDDILLNIFPEELLKQFPPITQNEIIQEGNSEAYMEMKDIAEKVDIQKINSENKHEEDIIDNDINNSNKIIK